MVVVMFYLYLRLISKLFRKQKISIVGTIPYDASHILKVITIYLFKSGIEIIKKSGLKLKDIRIVLLFSNSLIIFLNNCV